MHVGTPIEVALNGFQGAPARVVASSAGEDDAYVLLDINATGCRSLYGVNCHRRAGVWEEGNTANGPGWSQRSLDSPLGTLAFWGETLVNADRALIALNRDTVEVPVNEGVFLATWWSVPDGVFGFPFLAAVRVEGEWRESASQL